MTTESVIVPSIRAARASDASAVFELLRELGYTALDPSEYALAFESVTTHPEMRVFVAEDGSGRLVGLLSLSHRPQLRLGGTLVTIDELVVAEHGRANGIGRALLERARRVGVELGARRLELSTNRNRESYARGFYVKCGFAEVNSAVMRSK